MNQITRNRIFLENESLIRRTLRHNRHMLHALRLEEDDVYQELALVTLRAIERFDPFRCEDIRIHIWAHLQYAMLEIEHRCKHCGFSACDYFLMESLGRRGHMGSHVEDQLHDSRLREALARLDSSEREVIMLYIIGIEPVCGFQRDSFTSVIEKLRDFYLTARCVAGTL